MGRMARGCLAQCQSRGICRALGKAIGAFLPRHSKSAVKKVVCSHQGSFACLLEGTHRALCQPLLDKADTFGLPSTPDELHKRCRCGRPDQENARRMGTGEKTRPCKLASVD